MRYTKILSRFPGPGSAAVHLFQVFPLQPLVKAAVALDMAADAAVGAKGIFSGKRGEQKNEREEDSEEGSAQQHVGAEDEIQGGACNANEH